MIEDRKAVGTALEQVYAQFAYTPNGKQLWVKDAKANQTTYLYDGFDRLSRTTFPDATYEEMSYDVIGNVLTKRARNAQTMVNTYDALDRMLTHLTPQPGGAAAITTSFTYDLTGRPLSVLDSAGTGVVNSYDTAKRLVAVAKAGMAANYDYDPLGRRQAKTVNGVTTLFLSDGSEEVAEMDGAGAVLRRFIAGPGTDARPLAQARGVRR